MLSLNAVVLLFRVILALSANPEFYGTYGETHHYIDDFMS